MYTITIRLRNRIMDRRTVEASELSRIKNIWTAPQAGQRRPRYTVTIEPAGE